MEDIHHDIPGNEEVIVGMILIRKKTLWLEIKAKL